MRNIRGAGNRGPDNGGGGVAGFGESVVARVEVLSFLLGESKRGGRIRRREKGGREGRASVL